MSENEERGRRKSERESEGERRVRESEGKK